MKHQLTKEEFDRLARDKQFKSGPFMDTFGDGPHEPYRPHRKLFGTLLDGTEVESHTRPGWKPGDEDA